MGENNDLKTGDTLFDDDELIFSDEVDEDSSAEKSTKAWKIVIADDEEEIHNITKMVLSDYTFEGIGFEFISTYSGEETKTILEEHPDAVMILLDVVMETDDAGLQVAKYIREELKNTFVRIILRTGQPGKSPERKVIMEYDINDYKEKTELTNQKLYTTVMSSLRSYRDLKIIERNRIGLEQIINSSPRLFEHQSIQQFTTGVLRQLLDILSLDEGMAELRPSGFAISKEKGEMEIISATDEFEQYIGKNAEEVLPQEIQDYLHRAISEKSSLFIGKIFIGCFFSEDGSINIIYLNAQKELTDLERDLILIFSTNIGVAFDNIHLNKEIVETQKEVITTLGEVVETRSKETANHVTRVSEFSSILATRLDLDVTEVEMLRLASPMHDVGKIGIPDSILNKPGRLTDEEFDIIKTHTTIGYEILKSSNREIMKMATIVALQHHERWDGKGYPNGTKGKDIHIYGRITAVADVFDALTHKRVYKEPWEVEKVVNIFKEERGKQFDPEITDIFLELIDDFLEINEKFK
ncbi:MAG: DUF3369 domain-containing protein [bacterium]|nr:DUF3369 domain-containing protein [bacterium]